MRIQRTLIATVVAAGALSLGLLGGAAMASMPAVFAPAGLSPVDEKIDTVPVPQAEYDVNSDGASFGSVASASSPEDEPDLIEAVATNGRTGYVFKKDLDAANGTTAAESFTTPEEALEWQAARGGESITIPVYESDGKTLVGQFMVDAAVDVVEETPKG